MTTDLRLCIVLVAKYFLPPSAEVETATGTASFIFTPLIPFEEVTRETVKIAVLEAFVLLDIDSDALAARMTPWIHRRFKQLVARGSRHLTDNGFFEVEVECSFCVDQLPPVDNILYVDAWIPLEGGHFDGDGDGNGDTDTYDFFNVEEILRELEKERIEKAVTCSICLIDAPVGSELARLPCSHRYHVECIGSWLERRKNCPFCRSCFPS